MTTPVVENPSLGERLLELGWQQGALFRAPSAQFSCNVQAPDNTDLNIQLKQRVVKGNEIFVLISQDCDINASVNSEPYVEALICTIEKRRDFLAQIRNSSRWFVINETIGLVAQAKYRVQFSKSLLLSLTPESWPTSQENLDRFIRWLGRRYDRPAVPDEIVRVFQQPVESILRHLAEEQSDVLLDFSRAVHEIRVKLPLREDPPFDLQLILMLRADELTEDEADAIEFVTEAIHTELDQSMVDLDDDILVTAEDISLAEYLATRPLLLEYLSYNGEELDGAEPYEAI